MRKLLDRLKECQGETLVETMVSILIFTLSSILLYSMITAATNINAEVREADQILQDEMIYAEKAEGIPTEGSVSFTIMVSDSAGTTTQKTINETVNYYQKGDSKYYSYFAVPAESE